MELESLKRQISFLRKNNKEIKKLVTDRHTQVCAYMENEHPEVEHAYDVWHVAKGTVSVIIVIKITAYPLPDEFVRYFRRKEEIDKSCQT